MKNENESVNQKHRLSANRKPASGTPETRLDALQKETRQTAKAPAPNPLPGFLGPSERLIRTVKHQHRSRAGNSPSVHLITVETKWKMNHSKEIESKPNESKRKVNSFCCPRCGCDRTRVTNTWLSKVGRNRLRRCLGCGEPINTQEVHVPEGMTVIVVRLDG